MTQNRFFTVSNSRYFVGTVCLINSLRLMGHHEEIVILDEGLDADQRELLGTQAMVVSSDQLFPHTVEKSGDRVFLSKPYPAFLDPDDVVIIIDGDMIVTGALDDAIAVARRGGVFAYGDPESERWFAEWHQIFDLRAPLRSGPYVNAGFVAFSATALPDLLERWWTLCMRLSEREDGILDDAVLHLDQDALNALLMSELPEETTVVGDVREEPAFAELARARLDDATHLRCSLDGRPSVILHNAGAGKPWEPHGWMHLRRNPYVRLIPRLLFRNDVAIRLHPSSVPAWLRPSMAGRLLAMLLGAANTVKVKAILPLWRRVPAARRRAYSRAVLGLVPRASRPPARHHG